MTVNGENYPWWGDFKKKEFYQGAFAQYEGDKEQASIVLHKEFPRLGVNFNRRFSLVRGESLTVSDALKSQEKNKYEQWFHFSEEFSFVDGGESDNIIFESSKLRVSVSPANLPRWLCM